MENLEIPGIISEIFILKNALLAKILRRTQSLRPLVEDSRSELSMRMIKTIQGMRKKFSYMTNLNDQPLTTVPNQINSCQAKLFSTIYFVRTNIILFNMVK